MGSSPLSRGILDEKNKTPFEVGIIPALAGNTNCVLESYYGPTDHPRSRGEYFREIGLETAELGSSPLSRGILVDKAI